MPKIVNHEARRLELLDAVWRVIARNGIEGTTMRAIAAETGWSSGVLQHYFASKRDILIAAHQLAYARVGERIGRYNDISSLDTLRNAIIEALPLDDERLIEARIEVSAWGMALSDPGFAEIKRQSLETWRKYLLEHVATARQEGSIRSSLPDDTIVHSILVLIDGLSAEAALHPELATNERQMAQLEALFSSLNSPAS